MSSMSCYKHDMTAAGDNSQQQQIKQNITD